MDLLTMYEMAVYMRDTATATQEYIEWALESLELALAMIQEGGC